MSRRWGGGGLAGPLARALQGQPAESWAGHSTRAKAPSSPGCCALTACRPAESRAGRTEQEHPRAAWDCGTRRGSQPGPGARSAPPGETRLLRAIRCCTRVQGQEAPAATGLFRPQPRATSRHGPSTIPSTVELLQGPAGSLSRTAAGNRSPGIQSLLQALASQLEQGQERSQSGGRSPWVGTGAAPPAPAFTQLWGSRGGKCRGLSDGHSHGQRGQRSQPQHLQACLGRLCGRAPRPPQLRAPGGSSAGTKAPGGSL